MNFLLGPPSFSVLTFPPSLSLPIGFSPPSAPSSSPVPWRPPSFHPSLALVGSTEEPEHSGPARMLLNPAVGWITYRHPSFDLTWPHQGGCCMYVCQALLAPLAGSLCSTPIAAPASPRPVHPLTPTPFSLQSCSLPLNLNIRASPQIPALFPNETLYPTQSIAPCHRQVPSVSYFTLVWFPQLWGCSQGTLPPAPPPTHRLWGLMPPSDNSAGLGAGG